MSVCIPTNLFSNRPLISQICCKQISYLSDMKWQLFAQYCICRFPRYPVTSGWLSIHAYIFQYVCMSVSIFVFPYIYWVYLYGHISICLSLGCPGGYLCVCHTSICVSVAICPLVHQLSSFTLGFTATFIWIHRHSVITNPLSSGLRIFHFWTKQLQTWSKVWIPSSLTPSTLQNSIHHLSSLMSLLLRSLWGSYTWLVPFLILLN